MSAAASPERLESPAVLARHLQELVAADPRLAPVARAAGSFPLRTAPRGFAGLAQVVCGQQLSVASARAIWGRFAALPGALEPERFLALEDAAVRATGFSTGKIRTLRAVAEALADGRVDLAAAETMPVDEALAHLTAVKGIGPWTAEIYLLFCAAHPDVFPAGDLALQKAVAHGIGLAQRPAARDLAAIAAAWAPWRGTAALLFWRYFAVLRERDGIAL